MSAPATIQRLSRLRITAEMFEAMHRAGVLTRGPKVELRDGDLVEMSPQFEPHAELKFELSVRLREALRALGSPMRVVPEVSVRLDDYRVLEPDIVVWLAPKGDGFIPANVVKIAVEVSVTTLADDIGPRRLEYAGALVPEYWVADVRGRIIRQHAEPDDGDYRVVRTIRFGDPIEALTVAGLRIETFGL